MPNRTIYLPEELDRLARQLDVNLSRVTQDALVRLADARQRGDGDARRAIAEDIAAKYRDVPWVTLAAQRAEAGDDER